MKREDVAQNIREELISSGFSWLFEMEFLESKAAQDALALNLYSCSRAINDLEILIDQNTQSMLIWVKMKWWGKLLFKRREVEENVSDLIRQVLPSFRFRIVFDKWILNLAIQKKQEMLEQGEKDEGILKKPDNLPEPIPNSGDGAEPGEGDNKEDQLSQTQDLLPDNKQQTED